MKTEKKMELEKNKEIEKIKKMISANNKAYKEYYDRFEKIYIQTVKSKKLDDKTFDDLVKELKLVFEKFCNEHNIQGLLFLTYLLWEWDQKVIDKLKFNLEDIKTMNTIIITFMPIILYYAYRQDLNKHFKIDSPSSLIPHPQTEFDRLGINLFERIFKGNEKIMKSKKFLNFQILAPLVSDSLSFLIFTTEGKNFKKKPNEIYTSEMFEEAMKLKREGFTNITTFTKVLKNYGFDENLYESFEKMFRAYHKKGK